MNKIIESKKYLFKFGLAITVAFAFIIAFIIGICNFTNVLANPADSFADSNANEKVTVSGYVYYDKNIGQDVKLNEEDAEIVPVEGAKIYLDESDESSATTDTTGKFSFEVDQYSRHAIHAEWTSFTSEIFYVDYRDTAQNYYFEICINAIKQGNKFDHFAVINHCDFDSGDNLIPAGLISSVATEDGETLDEYTVTNKESVPILWDIKKSSKKKVGDIGQLNMPLNYKNSRVGIGADGKLTISFTVTHNGEEIQYFQTLTATPSAGYKFAGWYHLSSTEALVEGNIINNTENKSKVSDDRIFYEACCDGDYLFSYYDKATKKSDEDEELNEAPGITDGGKIDIIARFVPADDADNKLHVNMKVDDNSIGKGYLRGTNGNSTTTNATTYMTNFEFDIAKSNNSLFVGGINKEQITDDPFSNFPILTLGEYSDSWYYYEMNWIEHTTEPDYDLNREEAANFGYLELPKALPGNAFTGWDIVDKSLNPIEPDADGCFWFDTDITIIAKFAEATKLSGTIYDTDGNTVVGPEISFTDKDNFNTFNAVAYEDGTYTIDALAGESAGGTLTIMKNGYFVKTVSVTKEEIDLGLKDIGRASGGSAGLEKPSNPVYLCGETCYNTYEAVRSVRSSNRLNSKDVGGSNQLPGCTFLFRYNDGTNRSVYFSQFAPYQEEFYGNNVYVIPVDKGIAGTIYISHGGFETLVADVSSELTDQDPESEIDLAAEACNKGTAQVRSGLNGYFKIESDGYGYTYLANSNQMQVYVSVEDNEQGQLRVTYQDGTTKDVDYTAGENFLYGDVYQIDYLTGKLQVKRGEASLLDLTPLPNEDEDWQFFGWVGYTEKGERLELMNSGKLTGNLTIYAQFKKAAIMDAQDGQDGHLNYTMTFNSNELPHVGLPPQTWSDSSIQFRQYVGTTYKVNENQIVCNFDESQINPEEYGLPYIEDSVLTANAADGYTFDYWTINGERVESSDDVNRIVESNLTFDVQAVYKVSENPSPIEPDPIIPISEDTFGAAQTYDGFPVALFAIFAITALAIFGTRKLSKKF